MQTKLQRSHIADFVFGDTLLSPLWLVLRVYLGYEWVMAGWEKVTSPVWTGTQAGVAVHGFLMGALAKTTGEHPDVASWYAFFINHFALDHTALLSYLVAYGEISVGVALILGLFVGVASFFGMTMNFNYLFAGTVSVNPLFIVIEILLLLAWRTSGYLGLDKVVLPKVMHMLHRRH